MAFRHRCFINLAAPRGFGGLLGGVLGASWERLGPVLLCLGNIFGRLGAVLRRLGGILERIALLIRFENDF